MRQRDILFHHTIVTNIDIKMELNEYQKFIFGFVLFIIFVLIIIGFIVFMIYGCYKIIKLLVTFRNEMSNRRCYKSNNVEIIPLNTIHQKDIGINLI